MRPLTVLLVEDDPADVLLVQRALKHAQLRCEILVQNTAAGALGEIDRLRQTDATHLDALLLDLGLPDRDGLELLTELEERGWLDGLVTIALTGSHDPEVVRAVYEHGADSFMNKPINVNEFVDLLRAAGFWLHLSREP